MVNRSFRGLRIPPAKVEWAPIDFGEWLPDIEQFNNPGATEALNVLPTLRGFAPFKTFTPEGTLTLTSPVRGGIVLYDKSETAELYVGTSEGIYQRQGSVFAEVLAAPGLTQEYLWQFIQYGDFIVAVHPEVVPHAARVGGASTFSPLGGTPPTAACGARIGDFLVLGNLTNDPSDPDDTFRPYRIRWSGFNNIDAPWITDPATQADFNDMPAEGGPVLAITGREFGTIFQRRAISRMRYTGLPTVFDIETVEEARGALSSGSVVDIGNLTYFIADDGFFVWNGVSSEPLGNERVNDYFFKRLSWPDRDRIVGAVDVQNKCVVWAFPVASAGRELAELIVYSYKVNKFSHVGITVEHLLPSATRGTSIDDLLGDLNTDYNVSFDDDVYSGGVPYLAAVSPPVERVEYMDLDKLQGNLNEDYPVSFDYVGGSPRAFGLFGGVNMNAILDTGLYNAPNGERVWVNSARPLVDVALPQAAMAIGCCDQLLGEEVVFSPTFTQEITGEVPVLADGRYVKARVVLPEGLVWSYATGVEVWRKSLGRR